MTILKKLVATVGKYTTKSGEEKKRYVTVGHVHKGQYGEYITMEPHVSLSAIYAMQQLAGIAKPGDSRVYINMYDEQNEERQEPKEPAPEAKAELDDDIPF